MLDLSWKLFCMTGAIGPYLLIKEIEKEKGEEQKQPNDSRMNDIKEHAGA
ncbi:YqzL family protein [Sporolactobacillus shoreicorticis]|uniref:YqzL family protein n=1 Tax=Sporolactobacillus shoreicorticis TaxID=1923877 RepID=A0ABW5S3Y2_9BACL|nr:YqzL family protein [Sporolactobacillus shoreicorticis]MCO7126327.1 YqzL family protein [Sporolactobacillus shoreicorticis]